MRVLGISGSPRREGNTDILVTTALEVLAAEGLQTEFLSLADRPIKPCVACRGCFASDTIRCLLSEMIVPGSTYWNVAFGREKGEVRNDAEGMETVKNLARNMAWLMSRLGPRD